MRRTSITAMLRALAISASFVALTSSAAWAWSDVSSAASNDVRLGAHFADGWLHFGLYAPDAQQANLLLYDDPDATTPLQIVPLQKSGDTWQVKIQGAEARPGLHYLYEVHGPRTVSSADRHGLLFNEHYRLGDPYARRQGEAPPRRKPARLLAGRGHRRFEPVYPGLLGICVGA